MFHFETLSFCFAANTQKKKYSINKVCVASLAADGAVSVENGTDFMNVWKRIEKGHTEKFDDVQNTTIKLDGNIDINNELSTLLLAMCRRDIGVEARAEL